MIKKLISLALCLCIGLSMAACGEKSDDPLTFSTGIDESGFYDKIDAGEYFKLPEGIAEFKISKEDIEPSAEQIESFEMQLKQRCGDKKDVSDRPVKKGDIAVIDFNGKIGDISFTGGEATDYELMLGSNTFVPGFEAGIEGHNIGDVFEIKIVFPDNYGSVETDGNTIELSNQEATFTVTLKGIKEYYLTDEAVSKAFEEIGTLKDGTPVKTVEQAKEYGAEVARMGNAENYLFAYLMDNSETLKPIPQELIDNRIDLEIQYMDIAAKNYELKDAEELAQANGYDSLDAFIEENKIQVVMDIKRKMIMQELAEEFDIKVDDEDIVEFCMSKEEADAAIDEYGLPYMKQLVLGDKAFVQLLEQAMV